MGGGVFHNRGAGAKGDREEADDAGLAAMSVRSTTVVEERTDCDGKRGREAVAEDADEVANRDTANESPELVDAEHTEEEPVKDNFCRTCL